MAIMLASPSLTTMDLTPLNILTVFATAIIILITTWIVYCRFLHPLASVPGPFSASLSRYWYFRQTQLGNWAAVSRNLHAQYGPVVRIAPDEVSIGDVSATNVIYNVKTKWPKTVAYTSWATRNKFDTRHVELFADIDEQHAQSRRKLIASVYSMSSILDAEEYIDEHTQSFMAKLGAFADRKETFDLSAWLQYYAIDNLTELFFGSAAGCLDAGRDVSGTMKASDATLSLQAVLMVMPTYLRVPYVITKMLISPKFKASLKFAMSAMADPAKRRVNERLALPEQQQSGKGDKTQRKDLLAKLLDVAEKKAESDDFRISNVQQEAMVGLAVGSDTTTITLVAILHQLLNHSDAMHRVVQELEQAREAGTFTLPVRYSDAIKLPYLTGCVKEAMRLHPGVVGQMPRMVPSGGCEIAGHYIPEGTRVAVNTHVTHRDQSVFGSDAEEFRPERWLVGDVANMDRHMLHFGGGSRTCTGRQIALAEIYKLLPQLLLYFEIEQVEHSKYVDGTGHWLNRQSGLYVKVKRRI